MEKILKGLFDQQTLGRDRYLKELHEISTNKGVLKKDFNKWQKRRLLKIEDNLGLIAEKWAVDSFLQGVRFGVKFMTEIYGDTENHIEGNPL